MRYTALIVLTVITVASMPGKGWGDAAHHAGTASPDVAVPVPAPTAGTDPAGGMAGTGAGMMTPASSDDCKGGDCEPGGGATPIYPSLMTLPTLTPERRAEIEALASQQIAEGMARLREGSESLTRARQAGDHAAMQQSVGRMRESLAELEAGIAARRVLSEGKAPRNLALDWFKREMSLASPIPRDEPRALFGVTPFHLFTMGLLIAFALAMVGMYFFKMRRAAALFRRLDPGSGPPPPGGAPPLVGAPGPPSPAGPPAGRTPSAGGFPPPSAEPPSPPPATPAAERSEAPGPPAGGPSSPVAPTSLTFVARTPGASALLPGESSLAPVPAASSAPPMTANWRGWLRVERIVTETPSVKTVRLLPSPSGRPMPFTFLPGQFLNVAFGIGGARMNRSYSISSSPTQRDHVEVTVRREPRGAVSRHIHDLLKVGDAIEAGGPVGRFTFTGTESESIVLIAGGVGITPLMSIARYLTERAWAGDIFLIYTCRTPTDFIFAKEVAALERLNPKLHVAVTVSGAEGPDWSGPRGRISKELLVQTVPDLGSRRIHLCGPPAMMASIKAILTELGVPPDRVKTELFGAAKPSPAVAGTSLRPTAPGIGPLVTFAMNSKSAKIRVDQTVLELSEELGIGIEYSCRVGTCGVCKVKMTSGEVAMAIEDALEPDDKANGIILACQAKPRSDVVIEA